MPETQPGPACLSAAEIASARNTIRLAVESFNPGGQVTIQLISSAFAAVRRISELRRSYEAESDGPAHTNASAGVETAIAEYRAALKEWGQLLPRVQGWLLAEKARLETRMGHAASVQTWLDANRQTRQGTAVVSRPKRL